MNITPAPRRMPVYPAALVALVIACVCIGAGETPTERTWTSAQGNHKTEATLVSRDGDTVTLRRSDGKEVKLQLHQISPADRDYVRSVFPDAEGIATSPSGKPKPTTAAQIEEEIASLRSAKEVMLVYQFHLAGDHLPPHEKRKAEERFKYWKDLADKNFEKLGDKWMPHEEAEKIREEAEKKIALAYEQLRLNNGSRSHDLLKEASKLDPDNINADFLMGLVFSVVVDDDKKAIRHFKICLEREPGNVGVLNNLAICQFYEKDYNAAADTWIKAVGISPKTPALAQNVGSLITIASNDRRVRIANKRMDELSAAYEELITKHEQAPPAKIGFVYLPPAGLQSEEERRSGGKSQQIVMGSGTGFVIAPHIVATNHHVVEGAELLMIVDPKDTTKNLAAELIAADEEIDIAVIKCPGLNAKPLKLCTTLPPRGSDIAVLGYPLGQAYGNTIKLTRGSMVAMPDAANDHLCLYDALTNPGNSGGPLVDFEGRVVGVVRAIKGYVGGVYGMAIPMERAYPWLKQHVPELQDPVKAPVSNALALPEVDSLCAPSTVMVLQMGTFSGSVGSRSGADE